MDREILKKYFAPKKFTLIGLSILILFGTAIGSITPYIFGKVIDLIISGRISGILILMLLMLLLEIIGAILSSIENYFGSKVTLEISNLIKIDLFSKIICMGMENLDQYTKGELINRIENDTSAIAKSYLDFITGIFQIVISVIVSFYFAILLSKELTVVFILFFPILYGGTMIFKKKYKQSLERMKKFTDKLWGFTNEVFGNFEGLKSNVLESFFQKKMGVMFTESERVSKKFFVIQGEMNFFQNAINAMFDCFMLGVAGILISTRKLSIGNYVSFNQYIGTLTQATAQVMSFVVGLTACRVSVQRVEDIFNEPIEDVSLSDKNKVGTIENIKFESVTFGYQDALVLKGLNLTLNGAGMYAVVGKNGCGKSTLLKLLLRLYRQSAGNIFINGNNIKNFNLANLRQQISYIPKNSFLLNETVRFNITLGRKIDDKSLAEICRKVDLVDFIESLPHKYEEIIGENGCILSSGTKQKFAIARAMLQNTTLWLCDEITSDLDGDVEKKIVEILQKLAKDKIIIIISHKLSTIDKSNMIFLMHDGCIEEAGTNKEMIGRSCLYRQMFEESLNIS